MMTDRLPNAVHPSGQRPGPVTSDLYRDRQLAPLEDVYVVVVLEHDVVVSVFGPYDLRQAKDAVIEDYYNGTGLEPEWRSNAEATRWTCQYDDFLWTVQPMMQP